MIIDIHAHIYPDAIASKAAEGIGKFYDIPMCEDGTLATLLQTSGQAGIVLSVVHSVATVPRQVQSINNFVAGAVEQSNGRLLGFATMHPDYEDIPQEVSRAIGMGLRGIKIHPDFQKFNIDSPEAFKIYEAIEGRIPVLIHTGDYRYAYSKAWRVVNVLNQFPNLDVICAHFGGWSEWDEAVQTLAGRRLWVDSSSSLFSITPERAAQLIHLFGVERVLFGTDYPMWNPTEELQRFMNIPLTQEERTAILYENAKALLKL